MSTPDGYLGTDARISSGPAAELMAAGYALELADAPLLHEGLLLADLAHVIALSEQRLLPDEVAPPLLAGLLELGAVPAEDFPYDVTLGDAYNSRERVLTRRLGSLAGWVHLGRTRREAGRIAFRYAVRDRLLHLTSAAERFATALLDTADQTADWVWADVTYLQPAQASTFGHYLSSFAEEATRHLSRLRAAYTWADTSPAGAGGVAGTGLDLDRTRLAELLGFGRIGGNTRDTMWNLDGVLDVAHATTLGLLTADRLAEDLQIFASPGFGLLELDASLCRASVLMPQKRNPYALAVIRSSTSTAIGRATGLLTTARTPSAATDNWLHTYGEVTGLLEMGARVVSLAAAVVETLRIDRAALAAAAADPQVAMTDLADEIVVRAGLDYRTAYRITGRLIATVLATGGEITMTQVQAAARSVVGHDLGVDLDLVTTLDPVIQATRRREPGGSGPTQVRDRIAALTPLVSQSRQWRESHDAGAAAARSALLDLARRIAGRS